MIILNKTKCVGCGKCVEACPTGALYWVEKEVFVREELCRSCGACMEACPKGAISLNPFAFQGQTMAGFTENRVMRSMSIRYFPGGGRGGRRRFGRRRRHS